MALRSVTALRENLEGPAGTSLVFSVVTRGIPV